MKTVPVQGAEAFATSTAAMIGKPLGVWLVPGILLALVLFQGYRFQTTTSATYDEVTYLHMSEQVYRAGSFKDMIDQGVPPLPVLLTGWWAAFSAQDVPSTDQQVPALVSRSRLLAILFVGAPLVLTVYFLLSTRHGRVLGALGGGLVAFSPTVLAHSSLATTDACFTLCAVLAIAALNRYGEKPATGRFLLMSISVGLALASKQSAVFLFVIVAGFLGHLSWKGSRHLSPARRWTSVVVRVSTQVLMLVSIAFLVSWAFYGFRTGPLFYPKSLPAFYGVFGSFATWLQGQPAPASILTVLTQLGHLRRGHPAFLMGATSERGWWYFFPVAFALKSTPAELLLVVGSAVCVIRNRRWLTARTYLWVFSIVTFFSLTLLSRADAGERYILVVYPLLVLCAVDSLAASPTRRHAPAILGALLLLQASSAATILPDYLSYFPFYVGGPSEGHRYLVDSNLDWGQDLPALRNALEQRHYKNVLLSYFGTASPEAYGLRAVAWQGATDAQVATCDWVAISATRLEGLYGRREQFSSFRALSPTARAGYSIFLYQLRDPLVQSALAQARR